MNTWERIRAAMSPVLDFGFEDRTDLQDEVITDIVCIVREALLSQDAIEAAFFHGTVDMEIGSDGMALVRHNTSGMLTGALDAAGLTEQAAAGEGA